MGWKVIISPSAQADLAEIVSYAAHLSPRRLFFHPAASFSPNFLSHRHFPAYDARNVAGNWASWRLIPMSFQEDIKARRILGRWQGANEALTHGDLPRASKK
jgi:hypothetical protein